MDYKCKDFLILYIFICTKMLTGTLRRGLRPRTPRRSQPVGSRGTRGRPPPWRARVETMRKLPTLPSTTSTVCPDISAGNGGNVQEISCSKLKTLRRWRLIITFVNDINRGGNSVIKRQWKTSDEFAVVHPPTTRATLLWQSPSSKSKESLRVREACKTNFR